MQIVSFMSKLRDMLIERQAELEEQISKLRAQLVPLEEELDETKLARNAVEARVVLLPANGNASSARSVNYFSQLPSGWPFRNWTMKQMVRKALEDDYPEGATARQLLDLFHKEWGRTDIIRSSLSPQLSRLKAEGEIWRKGLIWRLIDSAELGEVAIREPEFLDDISPNENEPPNGNPEGGSETARHAPNKEVME